MNTENFIKEFKIYCETVEDTEGLEIIKQHYFDNMLNLETFIDDYIEIDLLKASNEDIVEEANRLSKVLKSVAETANYINSIDVRYVYLLIPKYSKNHIKEMFCDVMQTCYEELYEKIHPNEGWIDVRFELKESDFPKWYIDLCNLLDKYGI